MSYRLTRLAEADIEHVYREGVRLFGPVQASAYLSGLERALEFVAEFPLTNRERETREGLVRAHRFNAHMIIYQKDEAGDVEIVTILRVRHGREDWAD